MTSTGIVVFDLDGTLVDTAPDLINALNYVLGREGLPAVPVHSARKAIGAGARRMIERGLELEGRCCLRGDFWSHANVHARNLLSSRDPNAYAFAAHPPFKARP